MSEQNRVDWKQRSEYLARLRDLRIAVDREMDIAQVGAPTPTRIILAIQGALDARAEYRAKCQEIQSA